MQKEVVLREYREMSRSETGAASLLVIVRRHILPWFTDSPLFFGAETSAEFKTAGEPVTGSPVLCYSSMVSGDQDNPDLHRVRGMATVPFFYRLNHIRQLSTTNLAINLDAAHNRLSHCLGTLDIASRLIRSLQTKPKSIKLQPVEVKAVLVYAFIHDCFHGPMGHTLDLLKDVLWGPRAEERIDKHLLKEKIDIGLRTRSGNLWEAVRRFVADSDPECVSIFSHLQVFLSNQQKDKSFLTEIVDSDLDSDRLDYLWRDHIHLRMCPMPYERDVQNLIESATAIKTAARETHLHLGIQHRGTIEKILELRVAFYTEFYEHPVKTVADEMLTHAIYYVLEAEELLPQHARLAEFAEDFASLSDDGLFHFLAEATSKDLHAIPLALIQDIRCNRPFEIIYKRGLPRQQFPLLTLRVAAQENTLKRLFQEDQGEIKTLVRQRPLDLVRYSTVIKRFNQLVREPVRVSDEDARAIGRPETARQTLAYMEEEDIYRIQLIYGGGFRKKIWLERLFWRELRHRQTSHGEKFDDILAGLAITIAGSRGSDQQFVKDILERLTNTPLAFISLSWIPALSERALISHMRGFETNGIRFHKDGNPLQTEPELSVKARDEDYFLMVSAPTVLLRYQGMQKLIQDTFEEILFGRFWSMPEYLAEGRASF